MKLLLVTRMYSGLIESMKTGVWKPQGVPAIYKLIEGHNRKKNSLDVFFLPKTKLENKNIKKLKKISFKELQFVNFYLIPHYSIWINSDKLNQIYNDFIQFGIILFRVLLKKKYDLAYFDRTNIVLAAIFSFLGKKTVVRFLGITNFRYFLEKKTYILLSPLVFLSLKAPYLLVISSEDGSPSKALFNKCLNKKTPYKILLNGVENKNELLKDSGYSIRKEYGFSKNYQILLFIGRLTEDKGAREFFDSLLKLKEKSIDFYAICICGGSDYSIYSKKMSAVGMIHDVVFEKFIEHQSIGVYYDQADIYISLNKYGSLSNTVLEAMQAGKCVITLGKDEETCTDESTEKLVPNNAVIRIDRRNIVNDLTGKLSNLLQSPDRISGYSDRMKVFSKDFLWSWDQRIDYEMKLLEKITRGEAIDNTNE